jgi:DNA-binding MarR family transcriptional regulator
VTSDPSTNPSRSIHDDLDALFEESAALANRLKKNARQLHRNDNLSASGRGLLQSLLMHGSMTVPQLASSRSTSRQNIQILADRLEAAGYIGFVPNPAHKRSVLVALTDTGRAILASAGKREATLLENLLPHAAASQLREATDLLRALRYQLGGAPKQRRAKSAPAKEVKPAKHTTAPEPKPARIVAENDELPVNLL